MGWTMDFKPLEKCYWSQNCLLRQKNKTKKKQKKNKKNKTKQNILDVLAGFLSFKCCQNYCKIFEDKSQLGRAKSCKKKGWVNIKWWGQFFARWGTPTQKRKTKKLFFQSKSKLRQLAIIAHPSECQGIDQDHVKIPNYWLPSITNPPPQKKKKKHSQNTNKQIKI